MRIEDLAKTMIRLSGLTVRDQAHPDGDIEIREIGLRKGAKLYDALLIGTFPQKTDHPRIMRAHEAFLEWPALSAQLDRMDAALRSGDRDVALSLLSNLVPEFQGEQSVSALLEPGAATDD